MKKSTVFLFLIMCFSFLSSKTEAKHIEAYLDYTIFNAPDVGPFVETYLAVSGKSINYLKTDAGKFQGTIEVTMIFKQGDVVKNFKKYNLNSPECDDTSNVKFNFIDQQRFVLPNGKYVYELKIEDLNLKGKALSYKDSININIPNDKITISSIQLVESYKSTSEPNVLSKSGYDLVPSVWRFYPENNNKLIFYCEIYNSNKTFGENEKYLINYYIESFEKGTQLNDFSKNKRETAKPVNVLFNEFSITGLPTGNYNLVVEAKNKENKTVIINKVFFQRKNPSAKLKVEDLTNTITNNTFVEKITSVDSLSEYINCLYPISTEMEKAFAKSPLERKDLSLMQKYFFYFWQSRDNLNPEKAWYSYKKEVIKVNKAYTTPIRKGYLTDRGRVYLQYGPPNTITESVHEANTLPYEIWHYYKLGNQSNKKFVFCLSEIGSYDYELLHSDAIGETSDQNWQQRVRNTKLFKIDPDPVGKGGINDTWGDNLDNNFRNPR